MSYWLKATGLIAAVFFGLTAEILRADDAALSVLKARCMDCHTADEKNGGVELAGIKSQQTATHQRRKLRKALAQVEAGLMPPADAEQLTPEEKTKLIKWLRETIENINAKDLMFADPGPALVRRLTVAEYNNTIRDLLGFEFNAATIGISDDFSESNPFGNMAAASDISPALLEKYFAAADNVLDKFFGSELKTNFDGDLEERARSGRERLFGLKTNEWRNPRAEIKPPEGIEAAEYGRNIVEAFARRAYRGAATANDIDLLVKLHAQANERGFGYVASVRAAMKAVLVSPKFLLRIEHDRPGKKAFRVSDPELAVRLSYFLWSSMPDEELMEIAGRGTLSAPGPSPELVKYPVTAMFAKPDVDKPFDNDQRRVFDGDLETFQDGPDADSRWFVADFGRPRKLERLRFAPRIELEQRMQGGLFEASNAADFSSGVKELLRITEPPKKGWNSVELGDVGEFRYVRYTPPKNSWGNIAEMEIRGREEGTVLEQQVRRMLADPKSSAITSQFAMRWLQVNRLPTARPSTEFFPEFNADVRKALADEASLFFDSIRKDNLSVLTLLAADYTFVNEELAKFYKLPAVMGKEMRRIELPADSHRGGVLSMGSVLALTSHTSRTSPTLRGKWILEVIFGSPPPPPPANVSQIKEEPGQAKEVKTFREKLAQHAQDATCAACHKKLDPLGFALDQYNAVGLWREKDGDRQLDTSGELPGGIKLNGASDLKRVILDRKDDFVRNLVEQMSIYALGRELDYHDDYLVKSAVDRLKANDYRFDQLILAIVKSRPFQYRRGLDQVSE